MTPSKQLLHVLRIGATTWRPRWIAMLHGLYGRGRNWESFARNLEARRPDWGSVLIDLRLHGESLGFDPPHTLARAAEDVSGTVKDLTQGDDPVFVSAVLGHSFGGKVALALATPLAGTLSQVWVIDSTPEARAPSGSAWDMLAHVRALPTSFRSRAAAIAALEGRGWPTRVATWMASNLRYGDGLFQWTLDFDALEALARSFFATDLWSVVEQPPGNVEIHFVKAEESHALSEEVCARITRAHDANGRVHLHRVAGGHWLHVDNPHAILALLTDHLARG